MNKPGIRRTLALFTVAAVFFAMGKGGRAANFTSAQFPYVFKFPRDHGMHAQYRTEWWYFTGHLRGAGGRRFGYELTFFRIGLAPGAPALRANQSRWRSRQLFPAHFAVSDISGQNFFSSEKLERGALNFAGASATGLAVHDGSWSARMLSSGDIALSADAQGRAIQLDLRPLKPPVVQGLHGVSRKGACAACASHYYSYTRLATAGLISIPGARELVRGESWMDHEFSSSALASDEVGWDWFAIMLNDGTEIMLYRLRRADGSTVPESSGTYIERSGRAVHLSAGDFALDALARWRSPRTGANYPSGWHVRVPRLHLQLDVEPALQDQELGNDGGTPVYWEGASTVADMHRHLIGKAYVELTGYSSKLSL